MKRMRISDSLIFITICESKLCQLQRNVIMAKTENELSLFFLFFLFFFF